MSRGELVWVGAAPLGAEEMEKLRRGLVLQRTVVWIPTGLIIAMLLLYLFKLSLSSPESILTLSFTLLVGLILGRISGRQRFTQFQNALLEGLDIAPMLQEEGRTFAARVLGMPGGPDILDVLMRPHEGGTLAKERDKWGRVVYKTRAVDPKGPAEGSGADTIEARMPRIDAMTPRPEFEGLEGELTKGEKLIEEANFIRNIKSEEAWNYAEESDPELIESGVEKLGDLVAKGHDFGDGGDFP
ncbi:MAG: hypothetical protein VYB17_04275, partial [Candidatus Thermoplasmatota archaeon]|nr:hypothetical protein [Candidatus Thermoplasmatota archaeon]